MFAMATRLIDFCIRQSGQPPLPPPILIGVRYAPSNSFALFKPIHLLLLAMVECASFN